MHPNTTLPVGRGLLYILVAAVAWGTGGAVAVVLYETSGLGPLAVSCWRFAVGVVLLGAGHLWTRRQSSGGRWCADRGDSGMVRPEPAGRRRTGLVRPEPAGRRRTGRVRAAASNPRLRQVLITGIGLAVYQTAYFAAVGYAGLAIATVVTLGAGPILIAVGARVTLGERLGRSGAITVALALLGLLLLMSDGGGDTGSAPALGLACALLSATGYAVVTLLTRGTGGSGHTLLGGFAVGLLCLLPLALAEGLWPTSGNLTQAVAMLAYLGAVPTALAYALFFAGLTVIRATTAAVVALAEPLAATIIAVLWLDERLTIAGTFGSALLAGAVLTLTFTERRTRQRPKRERTVAPTADSANNGRDRSLNR